VALGSTRIGMYGQQQAGGSAGFSPADLDPVFWVDASLSAVVGGKLSNLGSGGSALDAQFGSTAPSSYFNGTALVLPGVAGNSASTPDATALDVAGDLDVTIDLSVDNFTLTNVLVSKDESAQRSWNITTATTGRVVFEQYDGTTIVGSSQCSSLLVAGQRTTVRVVKPAGVAAGVQFFYNGVAQSKASDTTTSAALPNTNAALRIGANFGSLNPLPGKVYRVTVKDGTTTVFDADFAKPFDTTSFTATTGQTVTLTRSTSGTDTNDPTLLPHTGTNYLYLPGVAGNYASTPDTPAISVTGDIEILCRVALDDWTPAAQAGLVTKYGGAGDRGWGVFVTPTGNFKLDWSTDGTTLTSATSSVGLGGADGTAYWIKVTRASVSGNVNFYWAADSSTEPTSWTQLGTQVVGATGGIFDNGPAIEVGARGGGGVDMATGKFYRAIVRNGIGGTTVFDADFTTGITSGAQASFTATTGQTVTIFRATSGRKAVAVTRPIVLLGTDDYFEVPDSASLNFGATDSFTVLMVARGFGLPSTNSRLLSKNGTTGPGYRIRLNSADGNPFFNITDGTITTDTAASPVSALTGGSMRVYTGVRNVTADQVATNSGSVMTTPSTDATTTTLSNTSVLRIGSDAPAAGSYADFEFVAAAVFRRALTAAEISNIVAWYGAS